MGVQNKVPERRICLWQSSSFAVFCILMVSILVAVGCGSGSSIQDGMDNLSAIHNNTNELHNNVAKLEIKYDPDKYSHYKVIAEPFDENISSEELFLDSSQPPGLLDESGVKEIQIRTDISVTYFIYFYDSEENYENNQYSDYSRYINRVERNKDR